MQELLRRPWPGNVRELKHTMACAAQVCSDDVMTVDHLPTPMRSASASTAGPSPAEAPPRSYITAGRRRLSDEVDADQHVVAEIARPASQGELLDGEIAVELDDLDSNVVPFPIAQIGRAHV